MHDNRPDFGPLFSAPPPAQPHSPTSRGAADAIAPTAMPSGRRESSAARDGVDPEAQRERIKAFLRATGVPQTENQIERGAHIDRNSTRWRMGELARSGEARVADKDGTSDAGKKCRRWTAA